MPTPFHLGHLRLLGARVTLRAVCRGKQRASQLMKRRITAAGGKVAQRGSARLLTQLMPFHVTGSWTLSFLILKKIPFRVYTYSARSDVRLANALTGICVS